MEVSRGQTSLDRQTPSVTGETPSVLDVSPFQREKSPEQAQEYTEDASSASVSVSEPVHDESRAPLGGPPARESHPGPEDAFLLHREVKELRQKLEASEIVHRKVAEQNEELKHQLAALEHERTAEAGQHTVHCGGDGG
jgi:hypothetical protein